MLRSKSDYYEQDALWCGLSAIEQERVCKTLALIPQRVRTILDVGCGCGYLTNRLHDLHYDVVGVDTSRTAIHHVTGAKALASVDALPFADQSFDLVLCTQVLEHLPRVVYEGCIGELLRVGRTYVLVSVPNREFLRQNFTRCPECGCEFHVHRHLRSISLETLCRDFWGFALVDCAYTDVRARYRTAFEVFLLHTLNHWPTTPTAMCPQCGSTGHYYSVWERNWVELGFIGLAALLHRLWPRRTWPYWLIALFQRTESRDS